MTATLKGTAAEDGVIYGTLAVQGQVLPARLVKTGTPDTSPLQAQAAIRSFMGARNEKDPKAKARMLAELAGKGSPSPQWSPVYTELLRTSGPAEVGEKDVRGYVELWLTAAKPYGPQYLADVRTQAVKALSGQKPYAALALALAEEAEKGTPADAPTELKAEIARGMADAATLLGKGDVAAAAQAKFRTLDAELDAAYKKSVPPFKPAARTARKGKGDAVVLLELFTGAQCPPCVAVDVAFDALESTYAPSEVITLQYHLHIPGPDPLTNADSVARAEYYPELGGTPTTLFNGSLEAPGGGPMAAAESKYQEFRERIDARLDKEKKATIDLQVDRKADEVTIVAVARAKGSKLKLRLALVEEQVKYAGGNKLRFHHHVVRAMPGGVEGKAVADGEAKVQATVKLGELRNSLEAYLSGFAKENGDFPNALPAIPLEHLAVVAFVQDDSDKAVLHVVQAPVSDAK
jgi:hypothetical protein